MPSCSLRRPHFFGLVCASPLDLSGTPLLALNVTLALLLLACLLSVLVAGSSSGSHDLEFHLAVLRAVEGVTGVNEFGTEGNRDRKQFGVHLYTRKAGEDRKMKRIACGADIPTKVDAALAAKAYVASAPPSSRRRRSGGACARQPGEVKNKCKIQQKWL